MSNFALIDVEHLILDVPSLALSLLRSSSGIKISYSSLADFEGIAFKFAAESLLKSTVKYDNHDEKQPSTIIDDFKRAENLENKLYSFSNLIKPYFNAPSFLYFISYCLKLQPIFVTPNPKLIISALTSYTNLSCLSLLHFIDPDFPISSLSSQSPDIAKISFSPVASKLAFEAVYSNACDAIPSSLYFVGFKESLEQLPPLHVLLSTQSIFFKSRRLLDLLMSSCGVENRLNKTPCIARSKTNSHQTLTDSWDVRLPLSLDDIDWNYFLTSSLSFATVNMISLKSFVYPKKVTPLIFSSPICYERWLWNHDHRVDPVTVFEGRVVAGFGRGSKELGIPTCNIDCREPVAGERLPFPGIYFGFASVWETPWASIPDNCLGMVMSVGYNPCYENKELTIEPHLFYEFPGDFYGAKLRLVVIGVLRAEASFPQFGHLVQAIQNDCEVARIQLSKLKENSPLEYLEYRNRLCLIE